MTKARARQVLGIDENASAEEIKRVYRRLVLKHHPDKNPEDTKGAEQRFKEINDAKEALLDKEGNKKEDSLDDLFNDNSNLSDFFDTIIRGGRGTFFRRGDDVHQTVEVTLEEAVAGCRKQTTVSRLMKCDACGGRGGSDEMACPHCEGKGKTEKVQGFFRMAHACMACEGKGKQYRNKCKPCNGQGRAPKTQTLAYVLKPGTVDGFSMVGKGEGNVGYDGGPSGDFFLHVLVKQHATFRRVKDDLIMNLPLSLGVAVLGGEIDVPTLLKGSVKMYVPAGTQHGTRFRIPGNGATEKGAQIVEASVVVPTNLTPKQKKAFKEFLEE